MTSRERRKQRLRPARRLDTRTRPGMLSRSVPACLAVSPLSRRPPEQPLNAAALAFGGPTRATIANSHRDDLLARRGRRALVAIALDGHGRADALGDDPRNDHDAFASLVAKPNLIADPDRVRGLHPHPIDPDVPASAGVGGDRTGLGQPHRPDPTVHPGALPLTHHPVTVLRCARAVSGRLGESRFGAWRPAAIPWAFDRVFMGGALLRAGHVLGRPWCPGRARGPAGWTGRLRRIGREEDHAQQQHRARAGCRQAIRSGERPLRELNGGPAER